MMNLQPTFTRVLDFVCQNPYQIRQIEEGLQNIRLKLLNYSLHPVNEEIPKFEPTIKKKKEMFDYKNCSAYTLLTNKFGINVRQQELIAIASSIGKKLRIKVDRDAKRRKDLLIKWFQDHLEEVTPLLKSVLVFDKNGSIRKTQTFDRAEDSEANEFPEEQ